jgi:hypothetical protein
MSFTSNITAANVLIPGHTYRVSFGYVYYSSGTLTVELGSTVVGTVSSAGPKQYTGVANGTDLNLVGNTFEGEFLVGDVMIEEMGTLADPVVITTTQHQELKKANTKNINYQIAYEKSSDIQIQRG